MQDSKPWDENILIERLSDNLKTEIAHFYCGNKTLDEFFHNEIFLCNKYCYVSAYCVKRADNNELVAIYTLMNDSLSISNTEEGKELIADISNNTEKEYAHIIKDQSSFPSVNIGHLWVSVKYQRTGLGSTIVNNIIGQLLEFSDFGCQFVTVDSINEPSVNSFYYRLSFENQTNCDINSETRRMFLLLRPYFAQEFFTA